MARAVRALPILVMAMALLPQPAVGGTQLGTGVVIHVAPNSGPPGTFTRVSGGGFVANESVDIYEDSYVFYTTQADDTGAFQGYRIQIKAFFGPGKLRIRAVGETSGLAAQVYFRVHTNWDQFHANAAHTADNEFENVIRPDNADLLIQRWFGLTGTTGLGSVAQVDGLVYVAGLGRLDAFGESGCGAPENCNPIWSSRLTGGSNSTPAVADGKVFLGDGGGLHVYDARSGVQLWTGPTTFGSQNAASVSGGFVFVGSTDHSLYAFDEAGCGQRTCAPLWRSATQGEIIGTPSVSDGLVYVPSRDGNVYAFDATGCGQQSCSPVWTAPIGGDPYGATAVSDGVVFEGSSQLFAIDAVTGSILWTGRTADIVGGAPAVSRGVVYVGTEGGVLYAFPAAGCGQPACDPLWTGATGSSLRGPAVANGVLFISSNDGFLYAFAAGGCGQPTCAPLASFAAPEATDPIVTDSFVLVNSQDGIRAFGFPGLTPRG